MAALRMTQSAAAMRPTFFGRIARHNVGASGLNERHDRMNDDTSALPAGRSDRGRAEGPLPALRQGQAVPGFLTVAPRCDVCGLDYSFADAGDGPAVFVILIVGFIVVGLALWMEVTLNPPLWLHFLLWIPLTLVLCLGGAAAAQGRADHAAIPNKAAEGRLDRPNEHDAGGTCRAAASRGCALCSACVAFAILLALGTWQVQRLHWKEALLATIDERIACRAACRSPRSRRCCQRPATSTTGRSPRPARSVTTASGISSRPGRAQSGYYVYTPLRARRRPLRLRQSRLRALRRKDAATRAARPGRRARSTVTGLARNPLADKPSCIVPDNDPAKNIFYWKDLDAMAASAGPAPRRDGRAVLHRRRRDAQSRRLADRRRHA